MAKPKTKATKKKTKAKKQTKAKQPKPTLAVQRRDGYMCKLYLNNNKTMVTGYGTTENSAKEAAFETARRRKLKVDNGRMEFEKVKRLPGNVS